MTINEEALDLLFFCNLSDERKNKLVERWVSEGDFIHLIFDRKNIEERYGVKISGSEWGVKRAEVECNTSLDEIYRFLAFGFADNFYVSPASWRKHDFETYMNCQISNEEWEKLVIDFKSQIEFDESFKDIMNNFLNENGDKYESLRRDDERI